MTLKLLGGSHSAGRVPKTSTPAGSRPVSSCASRSAVCAERLVGRVDRAAGEGHLARVRAHVVRAFGEQQVRAGRALPEEQEHGALPRHGALRRRELGQVAGGDLLRGPSYRLQPGRQLDGRRRDGHAASLPTGQARTSTPSWSLHGLSQIGVGAERPGLRRRSRHRRRPRTPRSADPGPRSSGPQPASGSASSGKVTPDATRQAQRAVGLGVEVVHAEHPHRAVGLLVAAPGSTAAPCGTGRTTGRTG